MQHISNTLIVSFAKGASQCLPCRQETLTFDGRSVFPQAVESASSAHEGVCRAKSQGSHAKEHEDTISNQDDVAATDGGDPSPKQCVPPEPNTDSGKLMQLVLSEKKRKSIDREDVNGNNATCDVGAIQCQSVDVGGEASIQQSASSQIMAAFENDCVVRIDEERDDPRHVISKKQKVRGDDYSRGTEYAASTNAEDRVRRAGEELNGGSNHNIKMRAKQFTEETEHEVSFESITNTHDDERKRQQCNNSDIDSFDGQEPLWDIDDSRRTTFDYRSDDDEKDAIICNGEVNDERGEHLARDADDESDEESDIVCLGSNSEESFAESFHCSAMKQGHINAANTANTMTSDNTPSHDEQVPLKEDSNVNLKPAARPTTSPTKKDVCYICGSDLSKLNTGIRGRVAHMKRCSAKHGKMIINNDVEFDGDFVASGEEGRVAIQTSTSWSTAVGVVNPYKRDWHGDASAELERNKPSEQSVSVDALKQTMLNKFFQAPVKSLTNVLMAGSRRLAKGKVIEAAKKKSAGSSSSGDGWRSYATRGNCPSYKRITGTDFICDGFFYAK